MGKNVNPKRMEAYDVMSGRKTTKKKRPCVPCRTAKRKCEGGFPCFRCIDKCETDQCVPVVQKKPGRKRKSEQSNNNTASNESTESPKHEDLEPAVKQEKLEDLFEAAAQQEKVETVNMGTPGAIIPSGTAMSQGEVKIEAVAQTLLSVLMSNAKNVLKERPRDIIQSFGLNLETFVAIEIPSSPFFPSKMDAFREATVESV